eukprot:10375796-Ditylum_brightwellii.AAC.1
MSSFDSAQQVDISKEGQPPNVPTGGAMKALQMSGEIATTWWENQLIQSSHNLHVTSSTDLSSHRKCTDTNGSISEKEACQKISIRKFASQTAQPHISPEETSAFADSLKDGRSVDKQKKTTIMIGKDVTNNISSYPDSSRSQCVTKATTYSYSTTKSGSGEEDTTQDIGGSRKRSTEEGRGENPPTRLVVLVWHGVAVPMMGQVTSANTAIVVCQMERKRPQRRKNGISQHKYGKGHYKKSKTCHFPLPSTVTPSARPTCAKTAPTM